ncbi:methyl-accepting chemotaxis protein [Clostridium sp. PL3]|uniref:Methyl-accepting chemotaxis protein n=1 Tax=Clostridium thailandense TaxID=2794346 RepID=A0A949X1U3_9CLOT|nr:methyl-accepting chemotaxis protein [Clostridium thailandense]MBV7272494.1 methyl-accepting chemotaxis protein [Clostridium thailandense]
MNNSKGIGIRLYMLIGFVVVFILGISCFSWVTFRNSSEQNKSRLQKTSEYINIVDEARKSQVDFKIQVQDWKDTLLRGNDTNSFSKYYSQFTQDNNNVNSDLLKLKDDMAKYDIDTHSVDAVLNTHKNLYDKYGKAIQSYDQKNINSYHAVDAMVTGIDRQPTEDMNALVKQIEDMANSEVQNMMKQSDIEAKNFNRNLICVSALGIILVIFFTILIISTYKDITKFIEQFKTLMEEAENGDLTIKGEIHKKDELDELTERFNRFIDKIRTLIYEAKDTSVTVASSSKEITRASDEVSKSIEEVSVTISNLAESAFKQAELAQQSNKGVIGVVAGLNLITANTMHINELANKAMETVVSGTSSLKHQSSRMINTKKASKNVTDVISDLSIKSNEIGNVVEFINDITDQINLLSLNASIEAAKAGEAGRGFTVVANEVKNLAELSKQSTQKISRLILDVQNNIKKAVTEVTNTRISIDEQETSLKLTDDSFNLIQTSISEMANKITEVADETEGINENAISVEKSLKDIVNLIEQNASSTEEVASSTEEQTASVEEVASSINQLAEMSNSLQRSLDKFKV